MWEKICAVAPVALLLTLLLAGGASTSEEAAAPVERPNVVLILADDLDAASIKRYPAAFPNITALADGGVSFDGAFAVDPLCCPSQATLLSGLYSHNHGVWDNAPPRGAAGTLSATRSPKHCRSGWMRRATSPASTVVTSTSTMVRRSRRGGTSGAQCR